METNVPLTVESKANLLSTTEKYLKKQYDFKYNVVTGKVEWKKVSNSKFEELTDYALNSLLRELNLKGYQISFSRLRSLLFSDFVVKYDPFHDYINALPEWDQVTDYIGQLANTVKTTNEPLWYNSFQKWIVAMTASLLDDDVVNHTAIVFSGKQGIGKTTWILNLVPPELKSYVFSGTINPDSKDAMIHLAETCLINLDELENLNKSQLGSTKELITKSNIRLRRPYGINNETLVRRASFAGSVNSKEFLSDTSGSRRFLVFDVFEIDYQHKVDMRMVFAQAAAMFRSGFQYWFNKAETEQIDRNNEQYREISMEEDLLLKWFAPVERHETTQHLTNTDIREFIAEREGLKMTDLSPKKLGAVLHKHGFINFKDPKDDRHKYALKSIKSMGVSLY